MENLFIYQRLLILICITVIVGLILSRYFLVHWRKVNQRVMRVILFIIINIVSSVCLIISYILLENIMQYELIHAICSIIIALTINFIVSSLLIRLFPLIAMENRVLNLSKKSRGQSQLKQVQEELRQLWQKKYEKSLYSARVAFQNNNLQKADKKYQHIIHGLESLQKVAGRFDLLESIAWGGRGQVAESLNHEDLAGDMFTKALRINPKTGQDSIPEIQSTIRFKAKEYAQAGLNSPNEIDVYLRYLALFKNTRDNNEYKLICSCLAQSASIKENETAHDENQRRQLNISILKINPALDWIHYNLGLSYFKDKRYLEADIHFQEAIRLNSRNAKAFYYSGLAALMNNQKEKAEIAFNNTLNINDGISEAHFELGRLLLEKLGASIPQVISHLEKAASLDRKNPDYLFYLGHAYMISQQFDKAETAYNNVIKIMPKFAAAHYALGIMYEKRGSYDIAIQSYSDAIEHNNAMAAAYSHLGVLYCTQRHNYSQARGFFAEAIKLGEDSDYLMFYAGLNNFYLKKYDESIELWQKLLQRRPRDNQLKGNIQNAMFQRAKETTEKWEYDSAIIYWKDYLKQFGANAKVEAVLAETLYRKGKFILLGGINKQISEAHQSLEEAVHLMPNNIIYQNWLVISILCMGNLELALDNLANLEISGKVPDDPVWKHCLGIALLDKDKIEKAIEYLQPLIDSNNQLTIQRAMLPLAYALHKSNRANEAQSIIHKYCHAASHSNTTITHKNLLYAQKLMAQSLLSKHSATKAEQLLHDMIEDNNDNLYIITEAILKAKKDEPGSIIIDLIQMALDNSGNPEVEELLAESSCFYAAMSIRQKLWDESLELLKRAMEYTTDANKISQLERCLEIVCNQPSWENASHYLETGNFQEAIDELTELYRSSSEDIQLLHTLATLNHEHAIKLEDDGITIDDLDFLWSDGIDYWASVWENNAYWKYLSERARTLDSTRNPKIIDNFRNDLPNLLFDINRDYIIKYQKDGDIAGAQRHLSYISESAFPFNVRDDYLSSLAEVYLSQASELQSHSQFDAAMDILEKWRMIDQECEEVKKEFNNLCFMMAKEYELKGDSEPDGQIYYAKAEAYLDKVLLYEPENEIASAGKAVISLKGSGIGGILEELMKRFGGI